MEGEYSFVLPADWDIPEAEWALMSESTKRQIKENFALEEEYGLRFRSAGVVVGGGGSGNPNTNFKSPVESHSAATVQVHSSAGASKCKKSHGRSDADKEEAKRQQKLGRNT
ncbi:hypothetical protein TRIUR3_32862 [Triticum urartu]|uniref:Uncharacterized protein n=1 Tax=Triticum urartu TaxID=4572 RepID=M8AWZ9_TRIUA|nr:hypothetical protein TRIUR3_32862 [Triticum urartu]